MRKTNILSVQRIKLAVLVLVCAVFSAMWFARGAASQSVTTDPVTVLGFNELGMHCMNQDFSELMILPPFNTLRAQIVDRSGSEPRILTSGVTVRYSIPSNTHSADKTNFWQFAPDLLGTVLQPNYGLTGNTLFGEMKPTGNNDWAATGIPMTPLNDAGREDPYPLANIKVYRQGQLVGQTRVVVPVSWEISCNLCHKRNNISTTTDILRKHDNLHGTNLENNKPVTCANCHADHALGKMGNPNLPSLSQAMHTAHAPRMAQAGLTNSCYACHPGIRAQCQRDVHFSKGITCENCHGNMEAVGAASRRPWIDEPRCGNCHQRPGFQFEQVGFLYKESKGHQGIHCAACHGSPHAITPAATAADNVQALAMQGHTGKIDQCTVCHRSRPNEIFPHRLGD